MTCLFSASRPPDYEVVRQALEAVDLDEALAVNPHGQLVAPGEELMLPPPQPAPPADGDEGENAAPPELRAAGDGVREEQARLVADRYGYIYDTGKELQVLSPLWVSADGMEVRFVHFRQLRAPANVDGGALQQMLGEVGVVADPDPEAVEQLLAGIPLVEMQTITLMNGEPAQAGEIGRAHV